MVCACTVSGCGKGSTASSGIGVGTAHPHRLCLPVYICWCLYHADSKNGRVRGTSCLAAPGATLIVPGSDPPQALGGLGHTMLYVSACSSTCRHQHSIGMPLEPAQPCVFRLPTCAQQGVNCMLCNRQALRMTCCCTASTGFCDPYLWSQLRCSRCMRMLWLSLEDNGKQGGCQPLAFCSYMTLCALA